MDSFSNIKNEGRKQSNDLILVLRINCQHNHTFTKTIILPRTTYNFTHYSIINKLLLTKHNKIVIFID